MRVCLEGHDRSEEGSDPTECWCSAEVIELDEVSELIALTFERSAKLIRLQHDAAVGRLG